MMSQLRQSEYQQKSREGLILVIRCTIYKHALDTSQRHRLVTWITSAKLQQLETDHGMAETKVSDVEYYVIWNS